MRTQSTVQPSITRTLRLIVRRNGHAVTIESCIHLPITASDHDIQVAIAASLSLYQNPLGPTPVDHRRHHHAAAVVQLATSEQWRVLHALGAEAGYSIAQLDDLIWARNCDPGTLSRAEAHALIDDFRHEIIQPISVLAY